MDRCETSSVEVLHHFREVTKMITIGNSRQRAAKNLATEMTNYNVEEKDLQGESVITGEHIQNNLSVREMLGQRGIKPENLPAAEDIRKLERKVKKQEKKIAEQSGKLPEIDNKSDTK